MRRFLVVGLLFLLVLTGVIAVDARPGPKAVRLPIAVAETSASVVVERGDHLWKISAVRLRGELGRQARDAEIWLYWRTVIEANVHRLRSGDPDLIYPGEVIELP